MVINSFEDITSNNYVFNFKVQSGYPDFRPVFNGGDIKIWIAQEGIVVSGRKICGHVGESIFKVGGTMVNSPLAISRTMLCKWEDIEIYSPRKRKRESSNRGETITLYSGITYSFSRGCEVIEGMVRAANRYRDQILRKNGEGVNKEVLNELVFRGAYYQDGKDMFFLKKPAGNYFFRKIMSVTEFEKVTLREKKKEVKSFNVFRL